MRTQYCVQLGPDGNNNDFHRVLYVQRITPEGLFEVRLSLCVITTSNVFNCLLIIFSYLKYIPLYIMIIIIITMK